MNTHNPYDTSSPYGDYPHSAVSPYYNVQHSSSARPESVENSTPVAGPSQHHIPSLNPEALRRPNDDSQHQYLSPSIPIDSQFTRRASTSAVYGQASTRTTATSGPYARPNRPTSFSNPLGHKRSASDSHFQPPRLGSGHQKPASAGKQPDLTPFGSAPPFPFLSYDEGRPLGQGPQWSTQYATSSSVDTPARTSSRHASYDMTPISSASPFAAPLPQSFDGASGEHPTWSNPEQVAFNSDDVESLPAPYSSSVPTTQLSTAPFTNYAQPSVPPPFSAPQSLNSATLHPDHAMRHTPAALKFPEAYTPASESYDGSPAGFLSTASSAFPSVPFDATATEQNAPSAESSHLLDSNTTYTSARLPYPPNVTSPALNPRTLDPSSYATPEAGPSSSEQRIKKSHAKKMIPYTQSSRPDASDSLNTMASNHDDSLAVVTTVKAKGTKRKHRGDKVRNDDDGEPEAGPSKKVKRSDLKERKKEGDREYQQECRQRANERRGEMWQLAGITTGTLEKRQEGLLKFVRLCSEGQCHPEVLSELARMQEMEPRLKGHIQVLQAQVLSLRRELADVRAAAQDRLEVLQEELSRWREFV